MFVLVEIQRKTSDGPLHVNREALLCRQCSNNKIAPLQVFTYAMFQIIVRVVTNEYISCKITAFRVCLSGKCMSNRIKNYRIEI